MTMDTSQVLDHAADLLDRSGWLQGKARNEDGAVCMIAAIWTIQHDNLTSGATADEIKEALNPVLGTASSKQWADWNDAQGRTKEEVVSALRSAAQRAFESAREDELACYEILGTGEQELSMGPAAERELVTA